MKILLLITVSVFIMAGVPTDAEEQTNEAMPELENAFEMEKRGMELLFQGMEDEKIQIEELKDMLQVNDHHQLENAFEMEKEGMKLLFKGMEDEKIQLEKLNDDLQVTKGRLDAMQA